MRIHHATLAKAKKFHITLTIEDNDIVATSKTGVRLASGPQGNKVLEDAITKATGKPPKGNAHKLTQVGTTAKQADAVKAAKPVVKADRFEEAAKADGWKKTRWGFSKEGEDSVQADSWEALCEDQGIEVGTDEPDDDSDADQSRSIVKAKYKERYKPTKDKCGDDLSFRINDHVTVEDDETGENRVSKKLLREFAEANGCWKPSYGSLVSRTGGWNAGMARMNVANILRGKIRKAEKAGEEFKVVWPKG